MHLRCALPPAPAYSHISHPSSVMRLRCRCLSTAIVDRPRARLALLDAAKLTTRQVPGCTNSSVCLCVLTNASVVRTPEQRLYNPLFHGACSMCSSYVFEGLGALL